MSGWSEAHRQVLQESADGKYVAGRPFDEAIRAALAEIARLTAEVQARGTWARLSATVELLEQVQRERDELRALVDYQATEIAQQKVVIEALKRDLEIE